MLRCFSARPWMWIPRRSRSEEHTSELQSRFDLVCRLLLEKKKKNIQDPACTVKREIFFNMSAALGIGQQNNLGLYYVSIGVLAFCLRRCLQVRFSSSCAR